MFVNLRVVDGSFLSTLSLRRATAVQVIIIVVDALFLSTLSLRRATGLGVGLYLVTEISIHALLAESDFASPFSIFWICHFYPRSPCGERLQAAQLVEADTGISIHALLAESD